ncbi:hypothetical protein M3J09_001531 [Ascochyta lentis]
MRAGQSETHPATRGMSLAQTAHNQWLYAIHCRFFLLLGVTIVDSTGDQCLATITTPETVLYDLLIL